MTSLDCIQMNTWSLKAALKEDQKSVPIEQVNVTNQFTVDTNINIEQAGLFKIFSPQSLNDALFNNAAIIKKFGRLRCLTSRQEYLAVGSNLGAVIVFYVGEGQPKGYVEIKRTEGTMTYSIFAAEVCQSEHGSVNQLSFNLSATQLAVGFDSGVLGLFDLVKNNNIRWIKHIHQSRIITLNYISENMVVSCDEAGQCYITRVQKGTFFYDVDSQFIFKQQPISVVKGLQLKGYFPFPDSSVFALANGQKGWVIKVNDVDVKIVTILATFQNDSPINNNALLEWSEAKLDGKMQLLLGIIWQSVELAVVLQGVETSLTEQKAIFKVIKQTSVEQLSIYMNCVYNNLILTINEKGNAYTTNQSYENLSSILTIPNFTLLPLMYWRDNKYETQYNCCIANNQSVQEIYYLTETAIGVLKYYNFQETFRHFMENNKYQLCFQILLCCRRKILMEIQDAEMLDMAGQSTTLYTQQICRMVLQGSRQEAELRTVALFDFIFKIQCEQLFRIIFEAFSRFLNDDGKFFVDNFTPFVRNQVVKVLPDETLMKIFAVYKMNGDITMIELLLKQLDILQVNQSVFLQACLENALFGPMITLCTQKNEFMTPLFQMWNYSLQQSAMEHFDAEVRYALEAISYMNLLLRGHLPNGEEMPQSQYFNIVEMLTVWLFEVDNLRRLVLVEPYASFELLHEVFRLSTVHLLEFSHKDNMYQKYIIRRAIDESVLRYLNPSYKENTEFRLESMAVERGYCYFLLRLSLQLKLKIDFSELLQVLLFCTYNPSFLFYIEQSVYEQIITEDEVDLQQSESHSDVIGYLHDLLILKLILQLETQSETEEEQTQIRWLTSLSELTSRPLVLCHFSAYNQQYTRPISMLLQSENHLIQLYTFKYLDKCLSQLQSTDKKYFDELNQVVVDKLYPLLKIDMKRTRTLVATYQKNNELKVIEQLKSTPDMQLLYIETLIAHGQLPHQILSLHLRLLCQLKPDAVLQNLQMIDYQIDDVLDICTQFNCREGLSYALEKVGKVIDAVHIEVDLLGQMIKVIQPKLKSFEQVTQNDFDAISNKMIHIVNICIKNNQHDDAEDSWYYYLDQLLQIANETDTAYKDILIQKIGLLFEDIASYTSLTLFADNLSQDYTQLHIIHYKLNFIKILNNFYYQVNFIQNIKIILCDVYFDEYIELAHQRQRGYSVECYCDLCLESLQEGCLFFCGHFLHFGCVENQQCAKCLKNEIVFLESIVHKQKQRSNKLLNQVTKEQEQTKLQAQIKPVPQKVDLKSNLRLFDKDRNSKILEVLSI